MRIYEISKPNNTKDFLKKLGVADGGISIISKKMELLYIKIENLKTPAVNILKQDALSIGAELAVPSGVILCEKEFYDCLLIGTKRELEHLSKKEKAQPFGLKSVAKVLEELLHKKSFPIKIMGVLNLNNDSFFSGSRFSQEDAVKQINIMVEDGAEIIDIGAQSSRPGSISVSEDEELQRVVNLLDTIRDKELYKKVIFSIDSYSPMVIEYALKCGFNLINDITGANNSAIIELATKYNAKLCIMHMQGLPKNMQDNPTYNSVIEDVDNFFREQIKKCEALGLSRDNIILDVGIGFGKSLEHNLELLKNHSHFMHFGCQLLIGASRKSLIDAIVPTSVEDRLAGTLAIHLKAIERGATIVRCHDVIEHNQAIKVWEKLI